MPTLAEMVAEWEMEPSNSNFKSATEIGVCVNDVLYLIPWFCLTECLWGMPDSFYPVDKYEWADHPLYFTTVEMVVQAITADSSKFKAFILYQPVRAWWNHK